MFENENALTTKEWIAMTALCAAISIPFLVIMRDMADSLQVIAKRR
jgi:hypothetical protein